MATEMGDAWSAYLRRMTARPGWSVARLHRESGIAKSTIFRWLAEGAGAGLTIQSVFLVADALGDDRRRAVEAAGNLPPEHDEGIALILASNRSDGVKAQMVDRYLRRVEEARQRTLDDIRFLLGQGETD